MQDNGSRHKYPSGCRGSSLLGMMFRSSFTFTVYSTRHIGHSVGLPATLESHVNDSAADNNAKKAYPDVAFIFLTIIEFVKNVHK